MMVKGFLFALGFGAGCLVFSFSLATAIVAIEMLALYFRKPKAMDGTVDILRWQERKLARKSGHENPAAQVHRS
jgi:hypothetical protein